MANFTNLPVLSKLVMGDQTYYLKDAEVRALIPGLESGISANAAEIAGLKTSKQDVVAFADGYDAANNKAATVKTVTDAIAGVTQIDFEIVTELPSTGKKGTIYLKKHTESGTDMYEEFIWVNNRFEKIGDTRIDLSNYYTKAQVDGLIDGVEALVAAEEERADAAEKANAAAIAAEEARAEGAENALGGRLTTAETKLAGIEAGAQVNKIEKIKLNGSDLAIDADKRVDLGSIATSEALEELEERMDDAETDIAALESNKEDKSALKALAYKDSASGTVEGQTISGVKASGTSTGELTGSLSYDSTSVASSGTYKPEGTVSLTGSAIASASLANNTPVTVKSMATAGSVASFSEGAFTAATLDHSESEFALEGMVASIAPDVEGVASETLVLSAASKANASLISKFNGGSKAADSFTANVLPTFEDKSVMPSSASISTSAAELSADFTGTSKAVEVSGNYDKANLGTVAFTGKAIELSVGDIAVAQKSVTVE